ncbi:hypothetical protein [Sphingomonas sp.]|uniref:hypothetical protein n=1 Tax=Sphingomonas sp. TaxID=28214 RepID=UPI003341E6C7
MARLTRNTSGRWAAQKVVPADVRAAFGQREVKRTWDAALTAGQAKATMAVWLAGIENRIASLRLIAAPSEATTAMALSQRDCRALAGVWYDDLKGRYEANPGDAEGWEAMQDEAIPDETTETYDMTAEEAEALPLRVSPWVRKEAVSLLASRGLRLTSETTDRVLQEMAGLSMQFAGLMVSRARGDWSTDAVPDRLPRWQESTAAKADRGPTITELFDLYVKERKPREAPPGSTLNGNQQPRGPPSDHPQNIDLKQFLPKRVRAICASQRVRTRRATTAGPPGGGGADEALKLQE